jgi:hypothetical protein
MKASGFERESDLLSAVAPGPGSKAPRLVSERGVDSPAPAA